MLSISKKQLLRQGEGEGLFDCYVDYQCILSYSEDERPLMFYFKVLKSIAACGLVMGPLLSTSSETMQILYFNFLFEAYIRARVTVNHLSKEKVLRHVVCV